MLGPLNDSIGSGSFSIRKCLYQYGLPPLRIQYGWNYGGFNHGFSLDYLVYMETQNEKLFNGRDFSPMDTIDLAIRECNAWFLANEEIDPGESTMECNTRTPTEVPTFICRVDGSWKNDETTSGVGWILQL